MSELKTSNPQWPPRSPHEALLSSPSGRDRLRRLRERGSPTPSPKKVTLRGSPSSSAFQRRLEVSKGSDGMDEADDVEDEETLQLQLQAIEARLKLKRLQQAKGKPAGTVASDDQQRLARETSTSPTRSRSTTSQNSRTNVPPRSVGASSRNASNQNVQVPLSPPPRQAPAAAQRSPGRVLLGIDKGLKGRDVSLRRAPVSRAGAVAHDALARTIADPAHANILKDVKAPNFDPPDVEGDWVLLGVIAAKSNPLNHKANQKNSKEESQESQRSKFMVLTMTELKWEVDVFLFSSAFDRFWKLTPGTVVAILNPSIMPPPPGRQDTGKFSLTLHSSDDTILEIGTARDLGFCKSVKKDGSLCKQWIDNRHTQYCTFHINASVAKTMAGRMEVNTMGRLFEPGSKRNKHNGRGGSSRGGRPHQSSGPVTTEWKQQGGQQDFATGARYFVAPSAGSRRSTANLLDDDDVDPDAFHRGSSKEERMRRRLVEQEREREIARKLGEGGRGMGGEYLRASQSNNSGIREPGQAGEDASTDPFDAESLGLSGGKAAAVSLSPVKRKRVQSGQSQDVGMGWGSAFKRGLPSSAPKAPPESTDQPARKKTRFITAKGIREAGRDSFGAPSPGGTMREGDDDGLEIV
ncbi:MAG: hypothetical protein M4579_000624 [Chaenotheca gracillima]|nr:MAG: hypothetical protein M4579_000624 [Chaenotheca gracillima]